MLPSVCTHTDRRRFLKTAAAVPLLWTRRGWSNGPASERLRVGCIGVGNRGTIIGDLACEQGVKIACADVDRSRAEQFATGIAAACREILT